MRVNALSHVMNDCGSSAPFGLKHVVRQHPAACSQIAKSLTCRAERLAGARSCPNWLIVRLPSAAQGEGPDPDSGEEMALCVASKIAGLYILNTPFVYVVRHNVVGDNQVAYLSCSL